MKASPFSQPYRLAAVIFAIIAVQQLARAGLEQSATAALGFPLYGALSWGCHKERFYALRAGLTVYALEAVLIVLVGYREGFDVVQLLMRAGVFAVLAYAARKVSSVTSPLGPTRNGGPQ